jgi:hypothetical protein
MAVGARVCRGSAAVMARRRCDSTRKHRAHSWVETIHYREGLRRKTKRLTHACPGVKSFGG